MANGFIDYNEQLLKYKEKALATKDGVFFDPPELSPKEITTIVSQPADFYAQELYNKETGEPQLDVKDELILSEVELYAKDPVVIADKTTLISPQTTKTLKGDTLKFPTVTPSLKPSKEGLELTFPTVIPSGLEYKSTGIDEATIGTKLVKDFTPTEKTPYPSVNPPTKDFAEIIPLRVNPYTLSNTKSKDGATIPANFLAELTKDVPAPTVEDENATKKAISLELSKVDINVPVAFLKSELTTPSKVVTLAGITSNTKDDFKAKLTEDTPAPTTEDPLATKKIISPFLSKVELADPLDVIFDKASLFSPNALLKGGAGIKGNSISDFTTDNNIKPIMDISVKAEGVAVEQTIIDVIVKEKLTFTSPTTSPNKNSDATANRLVPTKGANGIDGVDGVYQPMGALTVAASSIGIKPTKNTYEEIKSENMLVDYITRTEKSITGSDLKMFLFSLIPFQLGKAAEIAAMAVQTISAFVASPGDAVIKQIGTYRAVMATLSYASYFTIAELALSLTATPFTLGLLANVGISALQFKDKSNSIKLQKGNVLKLHFPVSFDPSDQVSNILGRAKSLSGEQMGSIEENMSIIYNGKLQKLSKVFDIGSYSGGFVEYRGKTKERSAIGESFGTDVKLLEDFRSSMNQAMGKYNVAADADARMQRSMMVDKVSFFDDPKFSFTNMEFLQDTIDPSKNDKALIGKWAPNFVEIYDNSMSRGIEESKPTQLGNKSQIIRDGQVGIFEELASWNDLIRSSSSKNNISVGYIYVYPTIQDSTIGKFKIPFQFNPILNESGQTANYQGSQSLHRTGQAFSYVNTDGQTLTLETDYLMLSDGKEGGRKTVDGKDWTVYNGPQNSFYTAWTPKIVQAIESALRSLVMPLAKTNSASGDIKFHKPPMIKIVMGQKPDATMVDSTNSMYSLLMHPIGTNKKYYHKTYIATNVTITRETESPYHIDGDNVTTHGFKVSIQLTEIDHNYISGTPDFMSYYNSYKQDPGSYLGKNGFLN